MSENSIFCTICNGEEFEKENGAFYCTSCGSESRKHGQDFVYEEYGTTHFDDENHSDLIDDKKDIIDNDVAYEPIEEGNKSDSEYSYASAEGEDDSKDDADDKSEQENMDEKT